MRWAGAKAIRTAQAYHNWRSRPGVRAQLARKIIRFRHQIWSVLSGSDIVLGAKLGDSLVLPHPNGVVIHQDAKIGSGCMIMQQVTIGMTNGGPPTIGDDVYVGAGAKLLGSISIGDGARIGANAVVLTDVPPGTTAVGVPAEIIFRKERAEMGAGNSLE